MPARILLLVLALAGCGEVRWFPGIAVGGGGPMRGTMTGSEMNDARSSRTWQDRRFEMERGR